jgi:ankyrin repeat protein
MPLPPGAIFDVETGGAGLDFEAKDPATGGSVLHYAVMRGNQNDRPAARAALDVNSRTKNGTTPLHTAVLYNRYEVAEKLLAKGADINAQSASGATPLALASAARNRTIAELLRSRGAK